MLGDGVNVATRLESIAEPGGVCLSGAAYDQVRKDLPLTYRDIIGLEVGPRPSFSFAGAWLYHDSQAVVHLKCPAMSNTDGAIEHVAFFTTAIDEVIEAIQARRIEHRIQELPDASLRQCFLKDPNGVLVEITGP